MLEFSIAGLLAPALISAMVFLLTLLLPARRVEGYLRDPDNGAPVEYRLNGLLVLFVVLGAWAVAVWLDGLPADWIYRERWSMLTGAFVAGLVYTLVLVVGEPSTGKGLVAELFLGRRENLTYFGRVDAKMYLYLVGATMLALNVVSFTAYHALTYGEDANPGIYLHSALLGFFILDYLVFERVHLYTYDIFAERLGFKLGWGCLVFYPFFYAVGLWNTSHLPGPELFAAGSVGWLISCAIVFCAGWMLARGANMQKYWFKRFPQRKFLGLIEPRDVSDGEQRLLCSGFWGLARHINYLGEVLMAIGITASLGYPGLLIPWLYPLYYVALLGSRERHDDRRCAEKYGPLWEVYRRRVPRRIIPGLY